jgi:carbon monoxide dehydrogenase subunit G
LDRAERPKTTLRKCIPGCQRLDMTPATEMDGVVGVQVGPVKAKFARRCSIMSSTRRSAGSSRNSAGG